MRTPANKAYAAIALLDRRDRLIIELALRVLDGRLKKGQANSDLPESAMHVLDELRAYPHLFHESNVGELQRFFTGAADIDAIAGQQGLDVAAEAPVPPTIDLKHVAYDRIHDAYHDTYFDLPAEVMANDIDGHICQIIKDSPMAFPVIEAIQKARNAALVPYPAPAVITPAIRDLIKLVIDLADPCTTPDARPTPLSPEECRTRAREQDERTNAEMRNRFLDRGYREDFYPVWKDAFRTALIYAETPHTDDPVTVRAMPDTADPSSDRTSMHDLVRDMRVATTAQEHVEARTAASTWLPAGLVERLRIHQADKRNTAFARSTMQETLAYAAIPLPVPVADWLSVPYNVTPWMKACMEEAQRHGKDVIAIWKAGIGSAPLPPTDSSDTTTATLERCIAECEKIRDNYTTQPCSYGPREAADLCVFALKELRAPLTPVAAQDKTQ